MRVQGESRRSITGRPSVIDSTQPVARPSRVRATRDTPIRSVARTRSRGQATVEFALIFPVFLLFTVGVVDMARIFSSYIAIVDGVREAALYAGESALNTVKWCAAPAPGKIPCPSGSTVANQKPDPDNIAFQIKSAGIDVAQVVMSAPVCLPSPCAPGSTVTIGASYRAPILTPILGNILGGSVKMSVETTATVLQ